MTKRSLQIIISLLVPIPIITGLLTMMGVNDPLYPMLGLNLPQNPTFDSNLRFFGGVWLGLGLAMAWLIPRIERETTLFRAIWWAIFIGGIARLVSIFIVGAPIMPFIGFTILEIIGAPLLILWQSRIANNSEAKHDQ